MGMRKMSNSRIVTTTAGAKPRLMLLPSLRFALAGMVAVIGLAGCTGPGASPSAQLTAVPSIQGTVTANPTVTPPATPTLSPAPAQPLKFVATGKMHMARSSATATRLQNGKVLIAGGGNTSDPFAEAVYASAELYDPFTGKFSNTGSMTAARADHTATLLEDGRVLITGGWGCSHPNSCSHMSGSTVEILASAEVYDPGTGKFSPTGSMATSRQVATATLLQDGRVLVAHGTAGVNQFAELYDPKSGKFARTGKETGFNYPTATLLPNGKVLVTGEMGSGEIRAELYDEATGKFTMTSIALSPGVAHSAQYKGQVVERVRPGQVTVLKDGRVVLFEGGYLETYDPATGVCADAGFVSPGGQWLGATATLLSDGRVLFEGGALLNDPDADYVNTNSAVVYDPSGGPEVIGQTLAARYNQTATLLPSGSVLIAGGEDSNEKPLASAELLKP